MRENADSLLGDMRGVMLSAPQGAFAIGLLAPVTDRLVDPTAKREAADYLTGLRTPRGPRMPPAAS